MRILFSANSFHLNKTRSSLFFIDLLKGRFTIDVVPHKDLFSVKNLSSYDVLVVWQHHFSPQLLKATQIPRIIFVPMYDDLPKNPIYWTNLKRLEVSVICFSQKLLPLMKSHALRHLYIQYYPIPAPKPVDFSTGLRGFFWQRNNDLTINEVIRLTQHLPIQRWHFHSEQDFQPKDDFSIPYSQTRWFDNQEDYQNLIKNCNLFVAPRKREVIGMSFLEALSLGHCVIAFDEGTMNEYISHGVDGILFNDPQIPLASHPSYSELGKRAHQRVQEGYQKWQSHLPSLLQFIQETPAQAKSAPFVSFCQKSLSFARNQYRKIKTILRSI